MDAFWGGPAGLHAGLRVLSQQKAQQQTGGPEEGGAGGTATLWLPPCQGTRITAALSGGPSVRFLSLPSLTSRMGNDNPAVASLKGIVKLLVGFPKPCPNFSK